MSAFLNEIRKSKTEGTHEKDEREDQKKSENGWNDKNTIGRPC
jgi:hypothetical protein